MNYGEVIKGPAQYGRGSDTTMVHMSEREVGGLAAMSPTGSLPINPYTGYPEAGFLENILPIVGSIAGGMIAPWGLPWLGAAIGSFGGTMLGGGSLGQGLLSGLMAGGMSFAGGKLFGGADPSQAANLTGGVAPAPAAPAGTSVFDGFMMSGGMPAAAGALDPTALAGGALNLSAAPAVGPSVMASAAPQAARSTGLSKIGDWISDNPMTAASAGIAGIGLLGGALEDPYDTEFPGLDDKDPPIIRTREEIEQRRARFDPNYRHGLNSEFDFGFQEGGLIRQPVGGTIGMPLPPIGEWDGWNTDKPNPFAPPVPQWGTAPRNMFSNNVLSNPHPENRPIAMPPRQAQPVPVGPSNFGNLIAPPGGPSSVPPSIMRPQMPAPPAPLAPLRRGPAPSPTLPTPPVGAIMAPVSGGGGGDQQANHFFSRS